MGMDKIWGNWWTYTLPNILAVCKLPKQDRNPSKAAIWWGRTNKHYEVTASVGEQGSEIKIKLRLT